MLWLVALILGWLLVEGQPSAGGLWTDPHLLTLQSAHMGWFLLLIGSAACLLGAGKRVLDWRFLVVVALGTWLPTLLLDGPFFRIGPKAAVGVMIAIGCMFSFRRRPDTVEPEEDAEEAASTPGSSRTLILGGAGTALALHGLGRILARMGDGSPGDTSVTIASFVTLIAFGAFAFGRPIPSLASKRNKLMAWIWFALMLCIIAALRAEQTLGTSAGLRTLMRRFELDLSHAGTTVGIVLTSVSILILPAFAVGTLVSALRQARRVGHVLFGAALATLLVPTALASDSLLASDLQPSLRLILWGMGLLAITGTWTWLAQKRKVHAGVGLIAGVLLTVTLPQDPILVPRPWQRTKVEPIWMVETPQGQLAVTSNGAGAYQALLDQTPLTADALNGRLNDRCMAVSMGLLEAKTRAKARILLVGVLSPHTADHLQALGASHIDRVVPFNSAVGHACESSLAGGQKYQRPPGDMIDREEASTRLKHGDYDLVLALPIPGVDCAPPSFPEDPKAVMVFWNALDGLQGTRISDRQGLLCSDGLARFAFAWTSTPGLDNASETSATSATLAAGEEGLSRLRWHTLRTWDRTPLGFAQSLGSFSQEASETDALLFGALQDLFAAQTLSSPFETEFQRFELPSEQVSRLVQALERGPSTPFYWEIAGGLARTLVGKRDVGAIMEFLPGLSKAMGEPYELERSLARAELESLEPRAAAARLQRLRQAWPAEVGLLEELGTALDQSEQHASAVGVWEALRGIHPGEWHFEKAWILSLVRAGDARAPAVLKAALASHPEDHDLLEVSQSGPLPPIDKGFRPLDGRHEEHDDHE